MPTVPELMPEKPKVSVLADQINQVKQRQQTDFVGTMQAVSKVNPDQFAKATAIERWSGVPADVLTKHQEKADALLASRKYENLYADYAKTARALADGKVAAIAHDDVENITRIEDAIGAAKFNQQSWADKNFFNPTDKWWQGRAQSSSASFATGLQNQLAVFDEIDRAGAAGEVPLGTLEQRQQAGAKGMIYLNATPEEKQQMRADLLKLQEGYSEKVASREKAIQAFLPDPAAVRAQRLGGDAGATWQAITEQPSYLWRVTAESAPNMVESLAAGLVAGPAGAGVASYNMEKGAKRLDVLREAKVDLTNPRAFLQALQNDELMADADRRSSLKAAGISAVDVLTAGLAGKMLMPAKAGMSQTGRELANLAIQMPVQGAGEAAGEATGQMLADGKVDGGEVLLEGLAGGLTSTLDVMTYGGDRVVRNIGDGLRKSRNAKVGKAALDQMVEAVEGGKLKGRDLETFKNVTSQQLKDSDIETVWIPAAKLQELNQSGIAILPELLKQIPGMGEQFTEAVARGGSVQMKTSDYLAHLGGFHDQLGDSVRLQADGMSVEDIKGWEDEQVAQLEMMAKAMKEEADPKSVVYQDAMGQLIAAGWQQQDAAQVAGLRTAMITKLSKRTGMSVEELMARDPLNIRKAAPEQVRKMPITDLGLMIDRLRTGDVPKPSDMFGKSLMEQLIADGGLQDDGGELSALDADVGKVGRNRVSRPDGKTLDHAALWAWERGYFPGVEEKDIGPDLIVNALRDEMAGKPRYSVAQENAILRDQADSLNALQDHLDQIGLDLSQMDNAQIIEALSKPQGEQEFNQDGARKTDTAAFKEWFADSKVVDADGKPLVVYHGTTSDFESFDREKVKTGVLGHGFYFASRPESTRTYSGGSRFGGAGYADGGNVMPVYLSIKNPMILKRGDKADAGAEAKGHDGVIQLDAEGNIHTLVAFRPEQIKSAIGNNGNYDKNDQNILHQSAFHGSPYRFDKFSLEHMGKGEGNQSYGWGLYFAGNKKVAEWYLGALADAEPKVDGGEYDNNNPAHRAAMQVFVAKQNGGDVQGVIDRLERSIEDLESRGKDWATEEAALQRATADLLKSGEPLPDYQEATTGQLYEVDIPEDGEYLLWDKPLSEQPQKVKDALESAATLNGAAGYKDTMTGQQIYEAEVAKAAKGGKYSFNEQAKAARDASQYLNWLGIAGIKYLDGSSRAAGEGDFNYVVFDDKAISVLDTYYQSDGGEGSPDDNRGSITFGGRKDGVREFTINLGQKADLSTVLHEFGHYYLEVIGDLVGDGKANAELAADYAEIRKWLGAEEGAKLTVDQHEQFARGFEKYLAEGKAPSIELQAAFARFKRWLVGIYKDLARLNVELTDEVRGVFDRLLASDEEIDAAMQVNQAVPMFENAEKAGMTEAEWAGYQNKLLLARDDAESDIARQIQAEEERRQSKWWNEQLGRIRKEVGEEVDLMPVYKAMKALRSGQFEGVAAAFKLQSGEVNERYGKRVLQRLAFMHAKQGGIPMDIVASMLGFQSGDEMVKEILGAPSRASAIEQEAQQRMLERHGNKVTGEAADKAMAAVHNERRADVLRVELEALAKQGSRKRVTSQQILKEAAKRIMQQRKVREIAPHEYQRAEAKAGREAFAAAAKGDLEAAYEAKQRQLLNFHLYREAVKAREQVARITERMKGYNKPSRRQKIGKAGHDYLDQIDAVMEQYEFRNVSLRELDKRVSFGQWYNDQVAAGNDPYVPEFILGSMGKTNYKDLSLDQLQELDEFTKHVEHLARFKNKLLANDRIASKEEATNMLVDGAYANMEVLGRELIDKNARDVSEETRDYLREGNSSLMKVEQVISWLDGNKTDGNWTQVFWRPLAEAQHKRDDMNREVTQKVNAAIKAWFDTLGKDAGQKIHIKGTNQPITRNGVLAVALNQGNAGNKAKLLKGYGWDQSVVDEILSHMTKADWQLVNDLWAIVGSLWPEIAAMEKQANGIAPAAVEHTPVETPYGVLSGGYWPLVYDTMSDAYANVLKDMGTLAPLSEQGQVRASTPRGHTKARVDGFSAPIVLDVSIIGHHLAGVIHDLTHRLPLADARSLLTTPSVVSALNKTIGKPMTAQFRNMVDGIAADLAPGSQKGIGVIQRSMNILRSNQAVAWMGYSVTTMMNQVGGYAQGMEYFAQKGARKHYLKALAKFAANPISQMEMARAMSGEMRNRDINLDQTLREATNQMIQVKDGHLVMDAWKSVKSGRDALVKYSFVPLQFVQRMVDVPVWMAAYELEGGALNHDLAVQAADKAVRLTQMAGGAKDLSSVQHSDLLRFFLPVYGYASLLWNRNVDVARAAGQGIKQRNAKQVLVAFERFIYLNILPALLSGAIKGTLPDDEDDEETWAAWIAVNSLLSVTNGVPLVRDVAAGAFSDFGYGGASQIGAGFGSLVKASGASSAEAITTNMIGAAGQLFGLPSSQINRAVRTGFALEDGEMEDSADAILRGILFGPPRE